ncbi:MAG: polysaccharide biosynthesis protein [Ruminococcaceae bacterium]|nr:polysaccharide biosynthesis protein [Oscillospiraceae bacterium]
MDRLKKFFVNGMLLTVVALATRYVSVSFNVYLSNRIGAVAMGVFTLISSVYGFALTLATSGVSLATTKLVSEAIGRQKIENSGISGTTSSIMKKSIILSLSISILISCLLFLSAEFVGRDLLKDIRTVPCLKILAFSLVPIAISSSLSGYFTAIRKVYKNAAVQILGQASRIYLSVYLLSRALANDVKSACVAIVSATVISELICFVFHFVSFIKEQKRAKCDSTRKGPKDINISKKLIRITLPVALSAYVRSALITVEHLLIPWGLERSGVGKNASLAAYGTIHSIIFPLVLFPSAISSSFAGLLVPEVSESTAALDSSRVDRIVERVLKTVLIYSIGTAGIMTCLSGEFAAVMIPRSDAATLIVMIAPLIPVMYLDTSVDSILKGLGYQFYGMVINVIDAFLSVILVWLLLPRFGVMGYIITVYFTELLNATLSITKLLCVTHPKIKLGDWIIKPLFSAILACSALRYTLALFGSFAQNKSELFFHVFLLAILYFCLLIAFKAISAKKIKASILGFIRA